MGGSERNLDIKLIKVRCRKSKRLKSYKMINKKTIRQNEGPRSGLLNYGESMAFTKIDREALRAGNSSRRRLESTGIESADTLVVWTVISTLLSEAKTGCERIPSRIFQELYSSAFLLVLFAVTTIWMVSSGWGVCTGVKRCRRPSAGQSPPVH